MSKIRVLSESMIGKIAAGEVVERPVSAIKELIENSLDAGATAVTAEIRDGGLTYIRVTDNGCGIEENDIRLAFERHATSKLVQEQDLYSIHTLGFRGEALASIAAVSKVTMTTRTQNHDTGLKVINEGGRILSIEETACTVGTTMTVTDLFFNAPVRRGFMKKATAEGNLINDLIAQMILSRPEVSFRFINSGKVLYHSPGDGQMPSAIMTVFGSQALKNMRKVRGSSQGIILDGYVGIGEEARGNRGHEYFFVNGRMMHSTLLSGALETACRERVMIGKFPTCALHLTIAYEAVDVNVHPNKLEVRFRDEAAIGEAVTTLVLEALQERDALERPVEMKLVSETKKDLFSAPESMLPIEKTRAEHGTVTIAKKLPPAAAIQPSAEKPVPVLQEKFAWGSQTKEDAEKSPEPVKMTERPESKAEQVNTILPEIKKALIIHGVLFNTYILIEYEDHLLLIDQHAVHERLLFDRLMNEQKNQNLGQELLVPIVLNVTRKEQSLLESQRDLLESIGLVTENFGERDIAVRTIPVILGQAETGAFVRELIAELENGKNLTFEKKRAELLQTACKHAVKGGEKLTEDQVRSLVTEMIEKKVTPTCPHGRPLVVSISHRELDKKFKRIQN